MKAKKPFFSIIVPVRNEAKLLANFLKSVKQLNYPPKIEVIIADGRSIDNSKEVAFKYGAKVVDNPKQTVGPGRNSAYKIAKGELIAFSDADCLVDKNWLENSLKYFSDPKLAGVGGPNFTPKNEPPFAQAVGFFLSQAIFSAGSIHGRNLPYIKETKSLPGCNSIYRKSVLDQVMPINESLLTCDDTEMNYRILDLGYRLLSVPDVFVWHYRRSTAERLWRQMYRWAIGRLQLGKKRREAINLVHIVIGLAIPIFIALLTFFIFVKPSSLPIFAGAIVLALISLFFFAFLEIRSLKIALNLPLVVVITIFAWSLGFLRELFAPLKTPAGH